LSHAIAVAATLRIGSTHSVPLLWKWLGSRSATWSLWSWSWPVHREALPSYRRHWPNRRLFPRKRFTESYDVARRQRPAVHV